MLRLRLLSIVLLGLAARAAAQQSLLPANLPAGWNLSRPDASFAARQNVSVAGQPFTQAVRVQTLKRPANPWDVQLSVPAARAVAEGDVIHATFWLRRAAPTNGDAFAEFVFERNSPPWTQSAVRLHAAGDGGWLRFSAAFQAAEAHAAGAAQVNFRLGWAAPQTVEIGGVTVTNWGQSKTLADFPDVVDYPGRAPDAPWRAAAAARIEALRKADLTVEVRDEFGQPVPGAAITLELTRHAFGFGTAVDGPRLLGQRGAGADRDRYRHVLTHLFNKAVLENDLKWPPWEESGVLNSNTALAALRWLHDRGLPVRGHNLIWPGTNQPYFLPPDVPGLFGSPAALRRRITNHFANILGQTRGLCVEWDVVNEPYANHDVQDVLGRGVMVEWFQLAKALDPHGPKLYLNEYGNLEFAGLDHPQTDAFFHEISFLQTNGAPLEGIGMQGHFGSFLPHPERLLGMLDRFAAFGLPIQATEFDINLRDEAAQADYTRDFTTALFSHPAVSGVLLWGFWEGQHWLPDAALFRRNWEPKPNAVAWSNLVLRTWWTRTNALSGPDGRATLRGFKGDYRVTVGRDGVTSTVPATLATNGALAVLLTNLPPRLSLSVSGETVSLGWPSASGDWRLQSSPTLAPPAWADEPDPPRPGFAGGWFWNGPVRGRQWNYRLRGN
ncbi:MAG: endo-1,4-beta-xylanase [Limisphaerales bacterium]